MSAETRTYEWWKSKSVDEALLAEIHGRIEDGASYPDIYRDLDLAIRCDIALGTFKEYATTYKRRLRVERATERDNYRKMLCKAAGIDLSTMEPMQRLKVGTAVEVILSEAKDNVRLRALAAQNFTEEVELKKAKNARQEREHTARMQRLRLNVEQLEKMVEGEEGFDADRARTLLREMWGLSQETDEQGAGTT